ncbi:MAG: UDP-N-acetylmuramoyl-tripeptide--D-alanyl-D-alanine ligase [Synergistaceae bacterium]|nr:UDP-N-acetylmuramoyl-tripeptide--D-alanyl-D-alanine ligase [Synergistaceae bacterium]
MSNMKLCELFEGIDSTLEFPNHLATDSRDVLPGGAFVALEGEKTDGHKYIPQAIERGAGLLIVRKGKAPEGVNIPVIELDNPERDLAATASRKLRARNLHDVIAITGSVGKTTTRAALQKVLSPHFVLHAPERSFNTLIGCTATIMAMPLETEIVILEFGANKPGEIRELTEYFPPTIAVLTAVAPVHLEGFGSVEGVLNEKLEIVHSTSISKIIYNHDNEYLAEAFRYVVKSMGVGEWRDSDFVLAVDKSEYTLPALSFVLAHRESQEIARFTANIWGKHNAMPLALAASVGHELGIDLQESADALSEFQALEGRGRVFILDNGHKFLVDDAYNANPASMRASLETFSKVVCAGKVAVLGEMRELGEDAAKYHAELAPLFEGIDGVILVGEIWREAFSGDSGYIFVDDWQEALKAVNEITSSREIQGVLVKGSHSIGLENVVRELCS